MTSKMKMKKNTKTITKSDVATLFDVIRRKNLSDFYDIGGQILVDPKDAKREALWLERSKDSKVLAVGHTDVRLYGEPRITLDYKHINCPQLDDRLGCWLILHPLLRLLPKDMPFDVLLTDNEEIGDSTADLFNPDKQYNWIFEFDRNGQEVVMYDYETPELKELMKEYGFDVGRGSFTDICMLDRLGCAAFNIGTGYYKEHTKECYANLEETAENVEKFIAFYKDQYHNHLLGDVVKAQKKRENKWSGNRSPNMFTEESYKADEGYDYTDNYYRDEDKVEVDDTIMFEEETDPHVYETGDYSALTSETIDILLAEDAALRTEYWEAVTVPQINKVLAKIQAKYVNQDYEGKVEV
jgi:hypothetical protein